MANEATITVSLEFKKGGTSTKLELLKKSLNVTGTNFLFNRQNVGTSEEALLLGDVATGGLFCGINRDNSKAIEMRSGAGATDLVQIEPGGGALFRISADSTAPFVIAENPGAELEYLILDA